MKNDHIEHRLYKPVGDVKTLCYRMPTHTELEAWGFTNALRFETWKVVGFMSLLTDVPFEEIEKLDHRDFNVGMLIVSRLAEQCEVRNHINMLKDKLGEE